MQGPHGGEQILSSLGSESGHSVRLRTGADNAESERSLSAWLCGAWTKFRSVMAPAILPSARQRNSGTKADQLLEIVDIVVPWLMDALIEVSEHLLIFIATINEPTLGD